MPMYSQKSFSRLATCHMDLQVIFYNVIRFVDCTILEGRRDEENQEKAYLAGKSKLRYPHSKHNSEPSRAVDVAPYPIDWGDLQRFHYFAGIVMGVASKLKEEGKISHSIRWGGAWDGIDKLNDKHAFNDYVHFELVE